MFDLVLHQPLNKWMDLMSLLIVGSCLASTLVWAMSGAAAATKGTIKC